MDKEQLANALAYRIQDILDGLSSGDSFDLEKEEKEISDLLDDFEKRVKQNG